MRLEQIPVEVAKTRFGEFLASKKFPVPTFIFVGLLFGIILGIVLNAFSRSNINALETIGLYIAFPFFIFIAAVAIRFKLKTRHWTSRYTKLIGLGYGLGSLLAIFNLFLTSFVTVSMSTTFPELINAKSLEVFLNLTSLPMQWIGMDIDSRVMAVFAIHHESGLASIASVGWRNYILGGIFFYNISPRLIDLFLDLVLNPSQTRAKNPTVESKEIIFAIKSATDNFEDFFKASEQELRLLYSIQYQIIMNDVDNTEDLGLRIKKKCWLETWHSAITSSIVEKLETSKEILISEITRLGVESCKKVYVLLFESIIFQPYYQLDKSKKQNSLKFDPKAGEILISDLIKDSKFSYSKVVSAKKSYLTRQKDYTSTDLWKKIAMVGAMTAVFATVGFLAAPLIGAAIGGSLGLSGIVAEMAGLAMLGGGAVAIGGMGMAGGVAIVVGGGAILGVGGGSVAAFYLVPGASSLIASDIAKVEAILYVLVLDEHPNPGEFLLQRLTSLKEGLEQALKSEDDSGEKSLFSMFSKSKSDHIAESIEIINSRIEELSSREL